MAFLRGSITLLTALAAVPLLAQPGTGTLRVALTGTNSGSCGSVASPCQTLQQAVQLAITGDQILVAGGTHVYNAAVSNPCTSSLGTPAVICVLNKDVTIRGGFSTGDWVTPNPGANPTIVDGQNARRVIQVIRTAVGQPSAGLTLTDFAVRNGRVVGASSGTDDATFAFGGGLLADASRVVMQRVAFENNLALGGSTATVYGGSGAGGGAALRACLAGTTFEDVSFATNIAQGGTGPTRGGFAVGGGLFVYDSEFLGIRLTLTGNDALGGDSPGSGTDGSGFQADALGGGVAFQVGTNAIVRGVMATGNEAIGGDASASSGTAAGAFGGAIYAEGSVSPGFATSVTIFDAELVGNATRGGAARNGGLAAGGAMMTADSTLDLSRFVAHSNDSLGGDASGGAGGPAGGGGLYLSHFSGSDTITLAHGVVAANHTALGTGTITGGGGGGLFLQGVTATLDHLTIDGNSLGGAGMQGNAMVLLAGLSGANVQLRWSAITGHTVPGAPAVHVQSGNTVTYTTGLWSGNSDNSNQGDGGAGTFVNSSAMTGVADLDYTAPGMPSFDYHLLATSPALDGATGSAALVDFEGHARSSPDIGADEYIAGLIFADGFETGDLTGWN